MLGTRTKYLKIFNHKLQFSFGTFALIMYYAKQIDAVAAKKMFDVTSSEFYYRVNYDLPVGELTDDDEQCHFDINDINAVIVFIESKLIPTLKAENGHLFGRYSGRENFVDLFYTDMGFLIGIGIDDDEYYDDNPADLIYYLNELIAFLRYAISLNKPYNVYVR